MTSPRALRWGLTLIALGVFWLMYRADYISWEVFYYLLTLWPLFLIAIGIEMIFKRSKLQALGYISPLMMAIVFVMAGQEAYLQENGQNGKSGRRYSHLVASDLEALSAKIDIGNYDLLIRARNDSRIRGRMTGWQKAPRMEYKVDGTNATLESIPQRGLFSWSWRSFHNMIQINGGRLAEPEYRLGLPDDKRLGLEVSGEDCHADIYLSEAALRSLVAEFEDATISLVVGDKEPLVEITFSGQGNRLQLSLPGGAGIRLDGDGISGDLSSYVERFGLAQIGDAFVTPGYDTLRPQIKITVEDELERLSIRTH